MHCFFCGTDAGRLSDIELTANWGHVGEYLKAGTFKACEPCQKRAARVVKAVLSSLKGAL